MQSSWPGFLRNAEFGRVSAPGSSSMKGAAKRLAFGDCTELEAPDTSFLVQSRWPSLLRKAVLGRIYTL